MADGGDAALARRLEAYGATPEFVRRIASGGGGGGASDPLAVPAASPSGRPVVPRLRLDAAAPYSTHVPRAKSYGVAPPRSVREAHATPRAATSRAPAAPKTPTPPPPHAAPHAPPTFLTDLDAEGHSSPEGPREAAPRGAEAAERSPYYDMPRVDEALWYRTHQPSHHIVREQVQQDVHNLLAGSREIRARLGSKPVARKATIDFLATPRQATGDLDSTYASYGPLAWSQHKHAELASRREAEQRRRDDLERWTRDRLDVLATYRAHKDEQERERADLAKRERAASKKYSRDLHRWMKAKASEDLNGFAEKRRAQMRRAEELRKERCGSFAIPGDLTVR